MLCFRFPKLADLNYLYINDKIKNNYKNLFKKIIQSKIMEKAMNVDENANIFKYPYKNDSILSEIEENCYLVPIPAQNYFGISDRNAFSIYINSIICTSDLKRIFIDIDNITKSKCHEFKHIYRIYIHIYRPEILLKTPEIKSRSLNMNPLTKGKSNYIKKKQKILDKIYEIKSITPNGLTDLDYGDLLEYAINGGKQNVFFVENSLFCLSEKSWELEEKIFVQNYFRTCFDKEFTLNRDKNKIFINSIIDYFNLGTKFKIFNDSYTSKRLSKEKFTIDNFDDNTHYYIPKVSHIHK